MVSKNPPQERAAPARQHGEAGLCDRAPERRIVTTVCFACSRGADQPSPCTPPVASAQLGVLFDPSFSGAAAEARWDGLLRASALPFCHRRRRRVSAAAPTDRLCCTCLCRLQQAEGPGGGPQAAWARVAQGTAAHGRTGSTRWYGHTAARCGLAGATQGGVSVSGMANARRGSSSHVCPPAIRCWLCVQRFNCCPLATDLHAGMER